MRPVAQGYAFVAFGDAQVDLALAEIQKGSSLQQVGEDRDKRSSKSISCICTSDPTVLGHLPRDGHLHDRGRGGGQLFAENGRVSHVCSRSPCHTRSLILPNTALLERLLSPSAGQTQIRGLLQLPCGHCRTESLLMRCRPPFCAFLFLIFMLTA